MKQNNRSYINLFKLSKNSIKENDEVNIWRAVIFQAFLDSTSNSKKPKDKRAKIKAIDWVSNSIEDFNTTCMLAQVDPDYIRSKLCQEINSRYQDKLDIPLTQMIKLKSNYFLNKNTFNRRLNISKISNKTNQIKFLPDIKQSSFQDKKGFNFYSRGLSSNYTARLQ